jgi:hypothetical protein
LCSDMHPSLFLGALLLGHAQAAVVHLVAPSSILDNASVILDRRLASFSIEFSFLPDFGGNKTHPNLLTKVDQDFSFVLLFANNAQELMQRLVERTGVGPDVRPGGITVDSSVFSPNASAVQRIETPVSIVCVCREVADLLISSYRRAASGRQYLDLLTFNPSTHGPFRHGSSGASTWGTTP